jgi:hypothetical protein
MRFVPRPLFQTRLYLLHPWSRHRIYALEVSKSELGAPTPELEVSKSELGAPMPELEVSTSELEVSKSGLGAPTPELGASKSELGAPMPELGASKSELGAPTPDLGASRSDIRPSMPGFGTSKSARRSPGHGRNGHPECLPVGVRPRSPQLYWARPQGGNLRDMRKCSVLQHGRIPDTQRYVL